ncbi:MAG: class II aldolase, partial [Geminicoccaceae bacterium]
ELETIAKQYYLTLCIGGPVLLSEAEIAHVQERFKSYWPRPKSEPANENAGEPAKKKKKKA